MLLDVVKKAAGREECALCAITYGPLGKRDGWKQCEKRLGITVEELHRDVLPAEWGIARAQLPCVLARHAQARPTVLVTREQVGECRGSVEALEQCITAALRRADERTALTRDSVDTKEKVACSA